MNRQEVCEKLYGICFECLEGYIEDCKTALPTGRDAHVVYTPGINEITIHVSLHSNISNYKLIRAEGICHNSNGNYKVKTSSQTAVISNLDSGTEYMCYVIPYIQTIGVNHQYTGNAIYNQTVMTMAEDSKSVAIIRRPKQSMMILRQKMQHLRRKMKQNAPLKIMKICRI